MHNPVKSVSTRVEYEDGTTTEICCPLAIQQQALTKDERVEEGRLYSKLVRELALLFGCAPFGDDVVNTARHTLQYSNGQRPRCLRQAADYVRANAQRLGGSGLASAAFKVAEEIEKLT